MSGILVAGVGNIFKGDDAFGVEVAQRLAQRQLPPDVKVVDFGIRGIDLTYALLDGYRAAVLVHAMQRGEKPGTVTIVGPEQPSSEELAPEDMLISPHDLDPAKVLRLVKALGGNCERCGATIKMRGRIAAPEMFPNHRSLPRLNCSRRREEAGGWDEAGKHGNAGGAAADGEPTVSK